MLAPFVRELAAEGRVSFTNRDLRKLKSPTSVALKAALRRLQKKGEIAMPYRGFYVILPPEYRAIGCLPPEQFIPDLMEHLGGVYYAGLLSAAEYHGAAHQRPQVFQVVVAKTRRPIQCGKVKVEFILRKNAGRIPIEKRNTPAGLLKVATPEATALDLVGYVNHCAGLDNVATILTELADRIDGKQLRKMALLSPIAWVQRLGYLMDLVGASEKTAEITEYVRKKHPVRTPLVPSRSIKGAKMDKRWKVFVNAEVEPEA